MRLFGPGRVKEIFVIFCVKCIYRGTKSLYRDKEWLEIIWGLSWLEHIIKGKPEERGKMSNGSCEEKYWCRGRGKVSWVKKPSNIEEVVM